MLVSVLMGVLNGAKTVAAAIDSIVSQTHQNWELMVCDDGSTDSTPEILASYAALDERIRLLRNERTLGLGSSLNRCVEDARGSILARQDADDVSHPERLEIQLRHLLERPHVSVLGTHCRLVDGGKVWGEKRPATVPTLEEWMWGSCVVHGSVMMRKDDLLDVGGYDGRVRAIRVEDRELWLRMLRHGKQFENLAVPLYDICQGLVDYGRRKLRYRIREAIVELKHCPRLPMPALKYAIWCKPLALGLIPNWVMFRAHHRRFLVDS